MAQASENQTVYLHHDWDFATSELIKRFAKVLKTGIYDGGSLVQVSGNDIQVLPFIALIRASTRQIVEIESDSSTDVTLSASKPYVAMTYTWSADENIYAPITAKSAGEIYDNDVVFGKGVYTGDPATLTSFVYDEKTWGLIDQSNNVNVQNNLFVHGKIDTNEFLFPTTEPTSPEEGSTYYNSATNRLYIFNGLDWGSGIRA